MRTGSAGISDITNVLSDVYLIAHGDGDVRQMGVTTIFAESDENHFF